MTYGRDRKTQSLDKHDKHGEYENDVDMKARERFKRKAYPQTDVIRYLETKGVDVGRVIDDGGCKDTKRKEKGVSQAVSETQQENKKD